jgi:signal transduction histidine kinase/BarA-like signal transduction histidine kinase
MLEINSWPFSKRRIKMIFTTSMVCLAMSVLWFVLASYLEIKTLSYYLLFAAVLFLTTAILSKNGHPKIARFLFILLFNFTIYFISSFLGKEASVEFFLFFAIGMPFVFFSFSREKVYIILFCLLPLVIWLLLYFTNFKPFFDIELKNPTRIKNIIYYFSITATLLFTVFQLIYYSYINAYANNNAHSTKQQALDASDAKSHFLSTMSHEIRTPLNAVIGLSHILSDNAPRKDQVQNIEALNYSGKILLNLLNNVLDFTKIESKEIELDNIPVDLSSAVKQIKKIHETSCLRKKIIMNLDIDESIPFVWLDIVRFNQIINNLVTNAIKFTNKGSITLRIKKINQTKDSIDLLTEIIDTGIGIPEDKREVIWEAFTQASSSTNRLYGGTGLGLPIVKNIVESMGSKISIDSEIDKGSRFYFQLNLKRASKEELFKTTNRKTYHFKGKKVLLVEDNMINVMVSQQILEKVDLKVEVARNGLSAVNMVKNNHYDIILMDIQMPIMDGYTASKEIRKFNKFIPIFALSASVFMQVKDKMNESGINGFIFKPFDPEDLLDQIENATKKS